MIIGKSQNHKPDPAFDFEKQELVKQHRREQLAFRLAFMMCEASNRSDKISIDIQSTMKDSENIDVAVRLYQISYAVIR